MAHSGLANAAGAARPGAAEGERAMRHATVSLLSGLLLLAAAAIAAAGPTYWTIEPQSQDEIPLAEVARFGGRTLPGADGVHFQLPDLKASQPVEVFLVSRSGAPLELIAFKTEPQEPLLQVTTNDEGTAEIKFRASGTVYFRISGPEGAEYQMIVLRGPAMEQGSGSLVPMSQVTQPAGIPPAASAPESTEPGAAPAEEPGAMTLVLVLLALILVVLVVIAFALLRGRRSGAAIVLLGLALPLLGHNPNAEAFDREKFMQSRVLRGDTPVPQYLKPSLVSRDNLSPQGEGFILGAKQRWDAVSAGHGQAAQVIDATLALGNFLNKYGFMDPKDAAVQPNYKPRGIPPLPASILDDPKASGERMIEYQTIADKIEKARKHLEGNYVVLKETELEAGMIMEMADAAAGLSPFAQLAWTQMKANPKTSFNTSAETFYAKYDAGQQSGLDYLNDALKEMGEFETKYYGQRNWYLYFGLPFHQFMTARYIRPDK